MIVKRNSASAVRDDIVVYWASPSGQLQIAPDSRITQEQLSRMREYRHWRRCEAVGAREIEKISLIISRQMFERKKQQKVQQALREMDLVKQAQISAKLRAAVNFSKNDVELNKTLEKRWAAREAAALAVIASEFAPDRRTTALEMELRPKSTSKLAHFAQKPEGIA